MSQLSLDLYESREGFFLAERKQKVIPCRGVELEPAENWRGYQQWKPESGSRITD